MKIKIQNGATETKLIFSDAENLNKAIIAIKNCIKYPEACPIMEYEDKTDNMIFTAEYLKNSLIIIPKFL